MERPIADIYDLFCSVSDKEEMKKLFSEIFTPSEIKAFDLRWELITRLSEGRAQREIAADLGISLCKITRGAKILKTEGGVISSAFKSEKAKKENI
jgi:TrpR family trp operon transcriptional repressor